MAKKKEIVLNIPSAILDINHWLVMGLDPSLSCTGYAFMHVYLNSWHEDPISIIPGTSGADWLQIGSCKPQETRNPVWLRAKLMALYLKEQMMKSSGTLNYMWGNLGLMVVMEAPTPGEDFLNRVNAIFHEHLFSDGDLSFKQIRILTVNASTLRSLMGLYTRGNNKGENIKRSYEFLDREKYPNLDSDACDAVMLSMVARHACSIMLGTSDEVPPRFLQTLCENSPVERGKGRNARITTKGLLHTTGQRPEYWYSYECKNYTLCVRDAAQPKKILNRINYPV